MSETLRTLLGIDALRPGQEGVEFGFEHPLPAWAWALIVSAAVVLAVLAYRRLEGRVWVRGLLGLARALLLVLLAVLICGPRLIKPNETEEKDWVLVLVDRSESMSIPDAPIGGDRASREQQLRMAVEAARPTWQALAGERVLIWLGFDGGAYELPLGAGGVPTFTDPIGRRTDIERAIEQALRRAAARPLSGVVLITDGRSVSEPGKQLLRRLDAEKVPIFPVALGSADAVADVAVRRVDGPRSAFVNDLVPVNVELDRTPAAQAKAGDASSVTVLELVDDATGAVLDSKDVDWGEERESDAAGPGETPASTPIVQRSRVTLTARSAGAGSVKWKVRTRPKAGGSDMIGENNSGELAIELVDRPLRVAVFDGYPRWEYRYLTSLLVRERSMSSVIMLLAPGRRYLQEGTVILDALPTTPEQWKNYDVIVMGDVLPSVFTTEQLEQIKQRVAVGGAGLVWIAGESATPGQWRGTPLADLLPVSLSESAAGLGGTAGSQEVFSGPVLVKPTLAAERLGVLRLADKPTSEGLYWPPSLSDPATSWAMLYWMQRFDARQLKPTAEVLAVATPLDGGTTGGGPAVLSMRFGAGRSVYVATDEVWRWRYGRGELLPERFWLQIIRLLGRESLSRSGRPALIEATPQSAETGQPVRVSVTLLDQALVDAAPLSVQVRVKRAAVESTGENVGDGPVELTLAPDSRPDDQSTGKLGGTRTYAATCIAGDPGKYTAESTDPSLSPGRGATLSTGIDVWQPDDELRQPQTDHPLLGRLAAASGGKVLTGEQLGQLPKLLPNRRVRLAGEPEIDTLWDSPLALMLVIGLLAAEWIGRRLLRLV
jgi:hypothetical protein